MITYGRNHKILAEDCRRIDVFALRKQGFFCKEGKEGSCIWPSPEGKWGQEYYVKASISALRVYMHYLPPGRCFGKEWTPSHSIWLTCSPCNFGRARWWFSCPICWSTRSVLYLPPNERQYGCRLCQRLTYQSRYESAYPGRYSNSAPR